MNYWECFFQTKEEEGRGRKRGKACHTLTQSSLPSGQSDFWEATNIVLCRSMCVGYKNWKINRKASLCWFLISVEFHSCCCNKKLRNYEMKLSCQVRLSCLSYEFTFISISINCLDIVRITIICVIIYRSCRLS